MTRAQERFHRTHLLIGDSGLQTLQRARILVVGLGAVGSFATEALARSGIGNLRLCDHDSVSLSNCNRQLYALESTLGESKACLAGARVKDINPECEVDIRECFANKDTLNDLLEAPLDCVVDAIDSLGPKVELLLACAKRDLPVFSCMGAARKKDPSQIKVSDISKTSVCPLARDVRVRLRRRGVTKGITCVFSTELPGKDTLAPPSQENIPNEGRPRCIMGSMPAITGMFGLMLANSAIDCILKSQSK